MASHIIHDVIQAIADSSTVPSDNPVTVTLHTHGISTRSHSVQDCIAEVHRMETSYTNTSKSTLVAAG